MESQKSNYSCSISGTMPDFDCKNIQPINQITKVRIYENGDCYDQNGNYLGKFLKQTIKSNKYEL
jgi:hypothetical protein